MCTLLEYRYLLHVLCPFVETFDLSNRLSCVGAGHIFLKTMFCLEYEMMDKVQKLSNSKCNVPSSESFRIGAYCYFILHTGLGVCLLQIKL
jgi:hypothetical protein